MFALLLLHFVFTGDIKGTVIMEPTSIDKHVIDINATVKKHAEIAPHILAAHAISECDTVSALYGIGKPTVINALHKGNISLPSNGDLGVVHFLPCIPGRSILIRAMKHFPGLLAGS